MKYLSRHKNLLAALIYFTLVVTGGIALAATDNWENPFVAFTSTALEGGHGAGRSGEGMPPLGNTDSTDMDENTTDTNTPMPRSQNGEGPGGHNTDGITWSQFGHVLYNIWFLFAAAEVVILISVPLRFIRQNIRRRNNLSGRVLQSAS